jgi:hypothetical protein
MRLVSADVNNNSKCDQITGLSISGNDAVLATWTAQNRAFTLPESNWTGLALSLEDCEENGGCLPNTTLKNCNLYPNPNKGHFTVEIPKSVETEVDVTLYNVLGVQVMKLQAKSGQNLPIQMDNFKTGTYLLQITGKDFSVNQNFIVE